jgi:predicted transcriptional regulator
MKVSDVVDALELTVFSGEEGVNNEVTGGYVSDLLSDVMGKANEGDVWITLQTHLNVLAVASLKDISAVILIGGNQPDKETMARSREEGIPVLGTDDAAFITAGKLYHLFKDKGIVQS